MHGLQETVVKPRYYVLIVLREQILRNILPVARALAFPQVARTEISMSCTALLPTFDPPSDWVR